jgi:hypothetical protein
MGKNICNSAFQKIFLIGKSVVIQIFILIIAGSWVGCGGGGTDEGPVTFSLRVVGEEEVVFDWTTDRCEDLDIPDLPARAFRDDSGQVQLIAGHATNRRNIGPDLNNLTHECGIIMESDEDPDPAAFNYWEWIGATYTEDGKTIYAIIHNEYHGYGRDPECYDVSGGCWYNSLTLAVSTDSGASYHHPVKPPGHLIAALPEQYVPGRDPYGIFHPSNIVKGKDGYYYSIWQPSVVLGTQKSGLCLVRTDDLSDPKSWRFWDGAGFDGTFINPYTEATENTEAHLCKPIESFKDIETSADSLTYNNYIDRYILIAPIPDPPYRSGLYYSVSEDLINWSPFKFFYDDEHNTPGLSVYQYASLLDPDSETKSFETTGKTAYLYYTHFNLDSLGNRTSDRDLVRVPVEFFKE